MIIDTHCHLDSADFEPDLNAVIDRANKGGVSKIISIGASDGFDSAARAVKIANTYENIFASVGVHPHDASLPLDLGILESLVSDPKVVAIGETGLDFHYNYASPEEQSRWFVTQIEFALRHKKPLIIHCRNAADLTYKLLLENSASKIGGVFHCFSETAEYAAKLREINFQISLTGIITFKKAQALREQIKQIPLSQIMVETDGPFLAPEPYRGKRCEPSFVVRTVEVLAEIFSMSARDVAEITTQNAINLFKI